MGQKYGPNIQSLLYFSVAVQGGPSARGTLFIDIKFKVPPQYFNFLYEGTTLISMSTKGCSQPDGPPCSNR